MRLHLARIVGAEHFRFLRMQALIDNIAQSVSCGVLLEGSERQCLGIGPLLIRHLSLADLIVLLQPLISPRRLFTRLLKL